MSLLQFLGRFHLLVLHLPIGFLLLAFLLEIAARRSTLLRPAVGFALFWGMAGAMLAAALGWCLSLNGDYDADTLGWHQWLGFATAGLSTLLYFLNKNQEKSSASRSLYLPVFGTTVLTLAAAGHFGGTLTHGSGYLFKAKEKTDEAANPVANLDSAEVFSEIILPVLKSKCGSCHNPSKRKGELVLLTKEGILKGGESGAAVLPENPAKSPLLKGIRLPLEDDLHMPPKGKKQLTDEEKKLLEWWVSAKAPFDKKVAECAMPEALRTALTAKAEKAVSPLMTLNLKPVSESVLQNLRKEGVPVYPLATGSPFLQALLSDRKDLSDAVLKKLKKVGKNIVSLDLGNSNADDKLLAALDDFPHLNRLYLDQTAVTDKGLACLSKLAFLEYLNLYKTQVTDAGLEQLKGLKNLKSVYLWQTGVSEKGIAVFASSHPHVFINKGIGNDSLFGDVSLQVPSVSSSTEIFSDTVHVFLKSNFGKANIHFTTNGAEPDSTSAIYEKPLVLDSSVQLKAIARGEGWKPSAAVAKQFFKIKYEPKNVTLAKPPNPKYAGDGGKTLGDFKRGNLNFGQGGWLGYQGEHLVATLDLGKSGEVSKVTVGVLENTGSWLFFPKGIRISISSDGKNFKKVKESSYPAATEQRPASIKNFMESFKKVQARFVKVEVLNLLKNPPWHPNKGEPCWIFVDEILVE